MNIRQYNKRIREIPIGGTVYINAINLNVKIIKQLKLDIQNGVIEPIRSELIKSVKPDFMEDFITGVSVLPQITYIKRRETHE